MAQEQWKPIKGYEDSYLISSYGRVLRLAYTQPNPRNTKVTSYYKLRLLKLRLNTQGYYQVSLSKNNIQKQIKTSRLVGLHFIRNPYNKPEINHKDGVKTNDYKDNLEWVTSSENQLHAYKIGLRNPPKLMLGKFGSDHHASKAVLQISNGKVIAEFGSMKEAKRETGIDDSSIGKVCNGKNHHAGGYQWEFKY